MKFSHYAPEQSVTLLCKASLCDRVSIVPKSFYVSVIPLAVDRGISSREDI